MTTPKRPSAGRVRSTFNGLPTSTAFARALLVAGSGLSMAGVAAPADVDPAAPLTAEIAAQLSQDVNRPVIVIMKNAFGGAEGARDQATFARDQASLMSELNQVNAAKIKQFKMVNSFAATVSDGEVARLKANPAVAEVIPDVMIRRAKRAKPSAAAATAAAAAAFVSKLSTSLIPNVIPGACGANGEVLLDPEALQVTKTASNDPSVATARAAGWTGKGVKVAWIADGVDPNNVNFLRKDGTSAFFDYQDFTGDGPGQITGGDEAFLDANAIAGQGLHVYDVNGFSAQLDPGACKIRIEGMAPGAAMLGLDVFASFEFTTESNFLEAIEYAVIVDHVDVLNESFGSNPFPDQTSQDATKLFNDAAVAAGTTVVVSSGDSGFTSTIGSPATDPLVISAGGSTTFRFYAQTNYAAARYFATSGWLNDNISSLSSSGFDQTGHTIDLVAPGDLGFASCSTDMAIYTECANFLGASSPIEESGGTSMSSPLTAGAAALVIEAYRGSHQGRSPSPATVKKILTSTASDLGVPAIEQGAGLINTFKATQLAAVIDNGSTGSGNSASTIAPDLGASGYSPALILSSNQLSAVEAPGKSVTFPLTVTNSNKESTHVQVAGRTFGPDENIQSGSVTLTDGSSPQFANYQGLQNNYAVFKFSVSKWADRLSASIAYPGVPANGNNSRVRLILIDPKGRLAAHSLPQGVGNFGNVDVRAPTPGTWTGVIFGDVATVGGTNGKVPWQVSTQQFVPFGSVSPSSFTLQAHESKIVKVTATTPENPGDTGASIVFDSSQSGTDPNLGVLHSTIPVTLRSLVDLDRGGDFKGVLTGGNGRPGGGQINYYEFDVSPGHTNITANVSLKNDSDDPVRLVLVNPDGVAVGFGQNSVNDANSLGLSAFTHDPLPGRWTLIVDFAQPVVGNEISEPFSGNIKLDGASATAPGLPDRYSDRLTAGVPVTIPVTVKNNGIAPEQFFIDARLNQTTKLTLANLAPPGAAAPDGCGTSGYPLPIGSTGCGAEPQWIVPTHTSSVQVHVDATLPVVFDYGPFPGDPDLFGAPDSLYTAKGSYTPAGGTVEQGFWYALPSEIGPYASAAPSGSANAAMTVTTKAFDPAVTSPQGDFWTGATQGAAIFNTFAPVTIAPGQSKVIEVTITPTGPAGTEVSGKLYVNDYVNGAIISGDEVAAIPYRYTIK